MGRMLTICCALAIAAGAQAQINHPYNEVGIYTVEQPVGCETAQIDVAPVTSVHLLRRVDQSVQREPSTGR